MHLLDSNAVLWWATEPEELSEESRASLSMSPRLVLSVASIWELEIKVAAKKLERPVGLWHDLADVGIDVIAIEQADALAAARLPLHHRDPFDRMIIAQALARGLTIVTRDAAFAAYGVPLLIA